MQRSDIVEARGGIVGLDGQAAVGGGERNWFGTASQLLMLLGLIASLVYFYFSMEHRGLVGKVSRFGVWILMIGFGASFGYTVQGRLSLAIGRALDVLGRDKDPLHAQQIHGAYVALASIVILVVGLLVWELARRRPTSGEGAGGAGADASH
jgi:hypothetical protein